MIAYWVIEWLKTDNGEEKNVVVLKEPYRWVTQAFKGHWAHLQIPSFTSLRIKWLKQLNLRRVCERSMQASWWIPGTLISPPQFGAVGVPPRASLGFGHFWDHYITVRPNQTNLLKWWRLTQKHKRGLVVLRGHYSSPESFQLYFSLSDNEDW